MQNREQRVKNYFRNVASEPLLYCFAAGVLAILIVENNLIISL